MQIEEDKVIYSNLINIDGSIPPQIDNKIILTYINIEQELTSRLGYQAIGNKAIQDSSVTNFNLHVLCSANFSKYENSLHFISTIFEYFSKNQVINKENCSELNGSFEKIVVELMPTSSEERNLIWKSIGVHYLPSLLYKIRVLQSKS